jgi:hypothetical protein
MAALTFAKDVVASLCDELDARAIEHEFVVLWKHGEVRHNWRVTTVNGHECDFEVSFGPGSAAYATHTQFHVNMFWRCCRGQLNAQGWSSEIVVVASASPAEIADRILQQLCDWGCINLDVVLK